MKEFEKWWDEQDYSGKSHYFGEKVWRAALEWSRDLVDRLGQEAIYDIDDELEAK